MADGQPGRAARVRGENKVGRGCVERLLPRHRLLQLDLETLRLVEARVIAPGGMDADGLGGKETQSSGVCVPHTTPMDLRNCDRSLWRLTCSPDFRSGKWQ